MVGSWLGVTQRGTGAQGCILIHGLQKSLSLGWVWNFRAHHQWYPSSDKATPPNPFPTATPWELSIQYMSLWGNLNSYSNYHNRQVSVSVPSGFSVCSTTQNHIPAYLCVCLTLHTHCISAKVWYCMWRYKYGHNLYLFMSFKCLDF